MPVIIAGMHRSGTSMTTRLLNLCGLYLGREEDLMPPMKDNPEGFWENIKFVGINDEILSSLGGRWDSPPLLEVGWEKSPLLTDITHRARQVISEISQQSIWGWKDPRNSLTLPFWKKLLPNSKIVICLRNPIEVHRSLSQRGHDFNNFTYDLWLTYYEQLITSTKPQERIYTHYDSYFHDPQSELRRLVDFLELNVSDETINIACQIISTSLKNNRSRINDLYTINAPDKLLDLYRGLCRQAGHIYERSLSSEKKIFLQNIKATKGFTITPSKRDVEKINQSLKIADAEVLQLQKEITKLLEEKSTLQYTMNNIFSSRSWKLMQFLQKIRLFFIPHGSAREKNIKLLFNSLFDKYMVNFIRILNSQDLRGFSRSSRNRIKKMDNPILLPKTNKSIHTKVICIHPRLASLTSHHFNEAHGFIQEFARRGKEFLLLVSVHAPAQITEELHARAVLDDPTFHMEWSFEERSHRFLNMLHTQVDADLNANDCVLITVSTQLEAHALTRWLQELSQNKKPWIVILFLSDRWNRSGREEYERQIAEFRTLKAAITHLAHEDAQRLIFCTLTDPLADELSILIGKKVDAAPIPLEYSDPGLYTSTKPYPHLPRVMVLGGTRREKGSYLIPDVVRACQSQVQVEFLIHLANNTLTPEESEKLAGITEEPHVIVIREPMSLPEYNFALGSADIALFPYEVIPYRQRTSGVFAEAVAFGLPVVATRGTWMAEQIEAGRAAGVIFDDLQPDSIAKAIAYCVNNLKPLQQSAQELSTEWRKKTSLSAFVDFIENKLRCAQEYEKKTYPNLKAKSDAVTPNCSFILSIEQGKLESQAILLVESLRKFGGAYADCPVYAVSPRPSLQMSKSCHDILKTMGVQVIIEELLSPNESYGPIARLATCAWAEKNIPSDIIVSLDNDIFFADEPDFSLKQVDLLARPVDVKDMCTSGPSDPFDEYWRKIAQLCGVDFEEIPWIETTVDRVSIKASYNTGMIAVRPQLGLFQKAEEMFNALRQSDLSPHILGHQQVYASTGFVGAEASRWWGTSQAVISLAATQLQARIAIAPINYNVPAHYDEVSLKNAILVHYHWLLFKDYIKESTVLTKGEELPYTVLQWLKSKTPLSDN